MKRERIHVSNPGPHDVLCGRGAKANKHEGNVLFRDLVKKHKMRYITASKIDKPQVAREVLKIWKNQSPPGRFLMKTSASDDESSDSWYEIDDGKAREKASQCLRERTPDVISVVQQIKKYHSKKDKAEKADKGEPSNEVATVDGHSAPVDSKDSKSLTSKNAPSEPNLSLHNQLRYWQLLQCQKMNMAIYNTAARSTGTIIPTVNTPLVHPSTAQMNAGGMSHDLQNLLILQNLHGASVPVPTAISIIPNNIMTTVVVQQPYAVNSTALRSNSQLLNAPQAYQSYLNNFGSYR